jgi:hypothetical protein
MRIEVVIAPLRYYMDPGKIWYAVKPTSPNGTIFFVSVTLHARLVTSVADVGMREMTKQVLQKMNLSDECFVRFQEVEPEMFGTYCDEGDRNVKFDPYPKSEECDHGNGD